MNTNELPEMDAYALHCINARVRELAARHGFPPDDREDLKQELFLKYLERKDGFDPARGSYKTFVSCLVRNRAASLVEKWRRASARMPLCPLYRANRASMPDELGIQQIDTVEEPVAEGADVALAVQRVLASLPDRLRYVASRIATEPVPEIAAELGISRDRVYQLVERLRTAFQTAGLAPALAGSR
jgi:RNA polymerase sigma-70 factor (ECF subfamily)